DKAIGPDYIPSNHGLSKDINFDSYDEVLLKRTIKEKYSPNHISLEERKKYLAREIIRKELFKKDEKEFSKESSYSHRKVQILMKMDEELKTEEFKEKIKEKQNELILN